jgi:hypothetical protein
VRQGGLTMSSKNVCHRRQSNSFLCSSGMYRSYRGSDQQTERAISASNAPTVSSFFPKHAPSLVWRGDGRRAQAHNSILATCVMFTLYATRLLLYEVHLPLTSWHLPHTRSDYTSGSRFIYLPVYKGIQYNKLSL